MNRIWYYTPDDRTDYPDINLLTPGMGVLTVLCVCLIFASAHLPQLPNPFHILFGYTTLVALNLLWQGRSYFRPRPLPSPMFACDDDRQMESWAANLHLVSAKHMTDFPEAKDIGLNYWLMRLFPKIRHAYRLLHYRID